MAGRRGSPTLRRRQLGQELRKLREAAGTTIDQVAERLACSASKISRIETGQSGVSSREVRDILAAYRVAGDKVDELVEMAREATRLCDSSTEPCSPAQSAASRLPRPSCDRSNAGGPRLLQTEEYARRWCRRVAEHANEEVEKRIRVAMKRSVVALSG